MINSVIWLICSSLHDYFALFVYVPRSDLWSVGHIEPKAETYTMGEFGKKSFRNHEQIWHKISLKMTLKFKPFDILMTGNVFFSLKS